jgi:hypothetical protein
MKIFFSIQSDGDNYKNRARSYAYLHIVCEILL